VLFVAWGYIDGPNLSEDLRTPTHVLPFAVPVLFLVALVGVSVLRESRVGVLRWAGIALAVYAWGWSVVGAIVGGEAVWVYFAQRGWPHYLSAWFLIMLTGLTLIGVAKLRSGSSRGIGALVLAMAVFGWAYTLTDSHAVLEARSVHIGSGLLFSLSWVALGLMLWSEAMRQAMESRT
jgi:hypothetical protein